MKKKIFSILILVIITIGLLKAQSVNEFRPQQCLNGWWDFQPVLTKAGKKYSEPGKIPVDGWLKNGMIVPGSWKCKPAYSWEKYELADWDKWKISNSFNFPSEWDSTNTVWYRRNLQIPVIKKDHNYFLRFDGILCESWIFVNGIEVGHRKEGTLPSTHEITKALKPGNNEIAVYVTDYKRDENGRPFVNIGCDQMTSQFGIWGDVFLEEKPLTRVENLTIRTSTRKNELTVIYSLRNISNKPITLTPEITVSTKDKAHLTFSDAAVTLQPNETKEITKVQSWAGYIPWSPKNPQLYYLNLSLKENDNCVDVFTERFGFREVWIEGHNIMLNGSPVHLLGEWGHKDHFDFFRPEYVRQWFGMLKDMNMNYIRTHTFPHPQWMIDMADEMGILVCLESAWFMSGDQALDKEEYWENAKDHARDNVNNYKNHPSVIFWSTGNEVRWAWNINQVIKHGPDIQKVYNDMDPTRVAYSDGSTSLWDERKQQILSRHYGLEVTGEDFWDKTKPLHVGEFGKWHFGQPIDNLVWGNDAVFGSFEKCATAIAQEAGDIILQARSNEVACMFPWNISCLDNYRPTPTETIHKWGDFTTPFAKPLRTAPYGSEFTWWLPESKGYTPGAGFNIIKYANRPFAIYVRERLNQVFDDQETPHTVSLINDLGNDVDGSLTVETWLAGKLVFSKTIPEKVKNGGTLKETLKIPAIKVNAKSEITIKTRFMQGKTLVDSVSRKVWDIPASEKSNPWNLDECLVFGSGTMKNMLKAHGVNFKYINRLDTILSVKTNPLLILEKNSVMAGSDQNVSLKSYMERGGRIFIMEAENSPMPEMSIDSKPAETSHIRAYNHPLMNKFNDDDFTYWGNHPYGKTNSESWVVSNPYWKPTSGNTTILLDDGFGDFGSGGLLWTPLFETRSGKGIAVISQLRLTEKMENHPSALKAVHEILSYLSGWKPTAATSLSVLDLQDKESVQTLGIQTVDESKASILLAQGKTILEADASARLMKKVSEGATLIIHSLDSAMITRLASQWKIDLKPINLGPQFNLVRENGDGLLNGISNGETNWLDKMTYTSGKENHKMCDWLFSSTQGKSLLSSESESCWREFYTKGAASEWLRMPVVTYYLYNGPRKSASGMMVFTVGKGKLILTQVPLPENGYAKAKTYWSQLLANLNVPFSKSLFDGEKTAEARQNSNGFPENVRVIKNPEKSTLDEIIAKCLPRVAFEHIGNQGLNDGFNWEKQKISGGEIGQLADSKESIIYFEVFTEKARKLQAVVGGWPDPSQQTMLDLIGKGTVTLYVNGKAYQSLKLDGSKASISDIDLNQGSNAVVIHFSPESPSLKLLWRNRQSRPETEFQFY